MSVGRKVRKFFRYLIPTLAVLLIAPFLERSRTERVNFEPFNFGDIKCAIAIREHDDTTTALLTDFSFDLIKAYAKDAGFKADIVLERWGENYIDSLHAGIVDMIIVPSEQDSLTGLALSSPIEGLSFGVLENKSAGVMQVDSWLSEFMTSTSYPAFRRRFFITSSPFKRASSGETYKIATPYDDLLKKCAASIGWDWRMMAALIWQESKFKIQVRSRRGAMGLMQMMPATATKMGCENIIDPEECIMTGTRYLDRLQNLFRKYAANQLELEKITLAAYNAGEGRIRDCINFASTVGADYSTWEGIASVIPQMREESILDVDTVKLGIFKGIETIAYVDAVQDLYKAYCQIAPSPGGTTSSTTAGAQSEPDQSSK